MPRGAGVAYHLPMRIRRLPTRRTPLLRAAVVVSVALVATLLPAGIAAPAGAEDPPPLISFPTVTTAFSTNPDPIVGRRFQIVGQVFLVIGDSPIPYPDRTVILERRVRSADPWVRVATAKTVQRTLPNGEKHVMFTFNLVASRTMTYRARYQSDSTAIGSSASTDNKRAPVLVRVHRKMPIRLVQPKRSRLYLVGTVAPKFGRQRVVVLRKTCVKCAWKRFARPKTNAKGRYRVRLSTPRRGSHYFIVRAKASKGFAVSYSRQARVRRG